MTKISKPPALAVRGGAWFRAGNCEIHLGVEPEFRPTKTAHPALLVSDIDLAALRLAAADFRVRWDTSIPELRRFHTDDPVGNRIEVMVG